MLIRYALLPFALSIGRVWAVSLGKYPPIEFYDRMALNDPGLEYSVYFPDPDSGVNQTWGVRMNSVGLGEIRTVVLGSNVTVHLVGTAVALLGAGFPGLSAANFTMDYTADVGISSIRTNYEDDPSELAKVYLGQSSLDQSFKSAAVTFTMKEGHMMSVVGANVTAMRHISP